MKLYSRRQFGQQGIGLVGLASSLTLPLFSCKPRPAVSEIVQASPSGTSRISGKVRIRQDAASDSPLARKHMALFAKGIKLLKQRPPSHPASFDFQGRLHGTNCRHGNYLFLPWHRAYISYFEDIIRQALTEDGDDGENFALPYWDWDNREGKIPPDFLDPSSPLYDATRKAESVRVFTTGATATSSIVASPVFEVGTGGPNTGCPLELGNHGLVHVTVGGNISRFTTAGLDPLFWCHHCNCDRIWASWMNYHQELLSDPGPDREVWRTSTFDGLYDRNGKAVSGTAVIDTLTSANFGFDYDSLVQVTPRSNPLGPASVDQIHSSLKIKGVASQNRSGGTEVLFRPTSEFLKGFDLIPDNGSALPPR